MKILLSIIVTCVVIHVSAQVNLEVEGQAKISTMNQADSANSLVVRLADGTLAVRDVSTLSGGSNRISSYIEDGMEMFDVIADFSKQTEMSLDKYL